MPLQRAQPIDGRRDSLAIFMGAAVPSPTIPCPSRSLGRRDASPTYHTMTRVCWLRNLLGAAMPLQTAYVDLAYFMISSWASRCLKHNCV
jgi:hypothetical protein